MHFFRQLFSKKTKAPTERLIDFAYLLHEVRAPMGAITSLASTLIETDLTSEQREQMGVIQHNCDALLDLINDFLDYAKLEHGEIQLQCVNFELGLLLHDICHLHATKAAEKNLDFHHDYDSRLPVLIQGDPGRLRQILNNLINNAIKYTDKGEITLSVKLLTRDRNICQLRFEISDTGIGIPANKMHLLFSPFQCLANERREGTGLGLVIVKKFITLMGGDITVESRPTGGTIFGFHLPFEIIHRQKRHSSHTQQCTSLSGQSICIVCDDKIARKELAFIMEKWQCHYHIYESLETFDFKNVACSGQHLLLLCTENLFETATHITQHILLQNRLQNIFVIALPRVGFRGEAKVFADIGCAAYLPMPLSEALLAQCFHRLIHQLWDPSEGILTRYHLTEDNQLRLMIVEDDPIQQRIMQRTLRKFGVKTDLFETGKEMLEALERKHYALILMDLHLADLTGVVLLQKISHHRKRFINPDVPIVVLTAYASPEQTEAVLREGAINCLRKPIKPEILSALVKQYICTADLDIPEEEYARELYENSKVFADFADDPEFIQEIVHSFLDDFPEQLLALQTAIEQSKVQECGALIHRMQGGVMNFGFEGTHWCLRDLSLSCKAKDWETAQTHFEELQIKFAQMKIALLQAIGRNE